MGSPDLGAVLGYGVEMGATSMELCRDYGGFTLVPDAEQYAAMLQNNGG